tara:strand:+ start:29 stop:2011 length:1983 start_codon:yes stop_codon:yes gene_type:complete
MKNISILFITIISININAQILSEDFESTSASIVTFPNGWTTSNAEWTINDPTTGTPGNSGSSTIIESIGSSISSGNCSNVYAIVDSDGLGNGNTQNTNLISPVMDLSNFTSVVLEFNHSFEVWADPVARVESSIDSGLTWSVVHDFGTTSKYGHEIFNISSIAGNSNVQIRFHYEGDFDWWWAIDDVVIKQAELVDIAITSLDIPNIDGPGSTDISGLITNLGLDSISSFNILWNDGTGQQSETININLGFNDSYNFTHSTPIQTTSLLTYNIDVEVVALGDGDSTNNLLSHTLTIASFTPFKKVLFEDQTIGANDFGFYSPRGIVRLEEIMLTSSIDSIEIISVHGNMGSGTSDAMYNMTYQSACFNNAFVSTNAWPQNMIDRKSITGYGEIIGSSMVDFNNYKNDFGYADIDIFTVYDTISRDLIVSTDLKFAINCSNLNLAVVITEDSVHDDIDMGYSQSNAYYLGNSIMATTGVDFLTAGNPVPPALMYFKNVAREIIPSFIGSNSALPDSLLGDSTYSFTFPTYTVPSEYDQSRLRAIVLLIDPSNGEVYNTKGENVDAPATSTVGIDNLSQFINFTIYPNPASTVATLNVEGIIGSNITLELYNLLGELVVSKNYTTSSDFRQDLDISGLNNGIYNVRLVVDGIIYSKKLQIIK